MSEQNVTAASRGLVSCHACNLLAKPQYTDAMLLCPRCGSRLHSRKPESLQRTVALLLAAAILYIPANVLPIMHSHTVLHDTNDTIMSGIVSLWNGGSWPIAVLVFFASILVPTLKLISLSLLVLSTHFKWQWRIRERTVLFRFLEFIGRWSMLDIFVVGLLVALVQLPLVANVEAGPGALAFGAVVVLTMYSTQSFDPRLMWDCAAAPVYPSAEMQSENERK